MKISVTILLKGQPCHLEEVLAALQGFDEVLIYDNGASPEALQICHKFSNTEIKEGPFLGFGPTHNQATAFAKNDWILSIDSDEVVTKELWEEIQRCPLDHTCIYSIPRHNEYNGKWIRWCGWSPDRVIRLYNRTKTQFSSALVHETVEHSDLKTIHLRSALKHYSYDTISDFLTKMQSYSDLFAQQNVGKKAASPFKALLHGVAAFGKSYLLKKGFLGGYEGFLISAYNGHTAFYKYLKLYEANCKLKDEQV